MYIDVNGQNPRFVIVAKQTGLVLKRDGNKMEVLGAEQFNRCFRIISHWLQLLVICPKTGAPLNLHLRLKNLPKRGRTIEISEDAWTRIAFLAKLTKGMTDMNRVELIALRINRMTREECVYWYSWTNRPEHVGTWSVKGLRIMLAGDGTDREAVQKMLSDLRSGV